MDEAICILVVDDEPDAELMFRHKFRKEIKAKQVNFHFSLSASEALNYLESPAHLTEATLILSDINMPGMNGLELLRVIKQKYTELPVLMVTAYGDETSQKTAEDYGASGFINKPVDFTRLKKDIFSLVGSSSLTAH